MKNLEIMGVQEMDAMEMIQVDGGKISEVQVLGVCIYDNGWCFKWCGTSLLRITF